MAENKKSFVLYCDLIHTVRKLPKDKVADLFLHILSYVNDENPTTEDMIIDIAFEPIKQQLKRDLKRYEAIVERNKNNGSKGGRPNKKPKKPTGLFGNPKNPDEPKKPDNDTGTDNVNDNEINFNIFWSVYPKKVAKEECKKKFLKLTPVEVGKILETVNDYVAYKPFETYVHPNPSTYLNQRRWEDVLPNVVPSGTKTKTNQLQRKYEDEDVYQ